MPNCQAFAGVEDYGNLPEGEVSRLCHAHWEIVLAECKADDRLPKKEHSDGA